ncbi:MAG: hypothetical protein V4510_02950 [bacterium]
MADLDPQSWSLFVRVLYAVGALYLAGFFAFFVTFQLALGRARSGDAAEVARYNRLLRGFPNAFYAKLLGRRPLVQGEGDEGQAR